MTAATLLACASCAVDRSPYAWLLVAGLIAAPYAVALAVLRVVRAASRGDAP